MEDTIFLTKASLPSYDEYVEEIKTIWDSNWITTFGPKHSCLESTLMKFLQCEKTMLFTNGHCALEMAIQAMGLSGEVITTPYTFASTTNAIVRNGLIPVFCDITPDTCNIDSQKIEELITENTSAIIPVHVYGNVCEIETISEIAKKHSIKVIYDAAHAFGVKYKGVSVATFGDASVFSFHASKVFNTAEGGAVCFDDIAFGERLKCIRNFGLEDADGIYPAGNGKMSELSASLGLCNLRHFEENVNKRKKLTEAYVGCLADIKEITFLKKQKDTVSNYAYLPIKLSNRENRDFLYINLQKKKIMCQKHFGIITSSFSCYKDRFKGNTPIAKEISEKILLLPLYADLREEQVIYICDVIRQLIEERNF